MKEQLFQAMIEKLSEVKQDINASIQSNETKVSEVFEEAEK